MEGDTPTFLYLIRNGLGVPDQPDWGSWGGRYRPIEEGGVQFANAFDRVTSVVDGQKYTSNHATIWRWREAFQNDFASRVQYAHSYQFRRV